MQRVSLPEDRRCTRVVLTPAGEQLFESLFPRQIRRIKERFDLLSKDELEQAYATLRILRRAFS